jgi:hypothetical protein
MPTIKPTDVNDCIQFINQHRAEIIKGVYDIQIDKEWVKEISNTELLFLIQHCEISVETIASMTTAENISGILARSHNSHIRWIVAGNENTSADLLENLAKESDHSIRCSVAYHANTPQHCLAVLAKDTRDNVRVSVANNRFASAGIL